MRALSPELLGQLYAQQSGIPLLTLITLTHASFGTIRLVDNTEDIISRGNTYLAFPVTIQLPADDGESAREVELRIDNASVEFIDELRSVTSPIDVTLEMVLSNLPDDVQVELGELKLRAISYNKTTITAKMVVDDFLNTEMASETYTPTIYPGLF